MKELLLQAMHEIQALRRHNEVLAAKVEMIDLFACVLHSKPPETRHGYADDVAWKMQKEIDKLTAEEEAAKAEKTNV